MQDDPKNLEDINQKLKQGDIVISNDHEILKDEPKEPEEVDVWTSPTLRRLRDTKKFLEEKTRKRARQSSCNKLE